MTEMRMLAVDRRQERALGGSIGEGSKEFTDGIHVSRQPGITTGITVGHEAQGGHRPAWHKAGE